MTGRAVVVGMAASGVAATRRLLVLGHDVVAVDDAPSPEVRQRAAELGVELVGAPGADRLQGLVTSAGIVVVSPGVPPMHPVFAAAEQHRVPLVAELDLGARAIERPIVAVTGTNGKTTVTTLVHQMLLAAGLKSVAAGNVGLPLTEVIGRDLDVVVVETSSFQLELSPSLHAAVGVWLNFAQDHLDWHPDLESYARAKARIWARQSPDDVAVANAEDREVMRWARRAPGRLVTFGATAGDYRVDSGWLRTPAGEGIVELAQLRRSLPHDVANALAAGAAAVSAGAPVEAVAAVLRRFEGLPHRPTLVSDAGGVRWYDDSKATNPHAALAAVAGFESVVLVAGGRNKGLDLSPLAAAAERLRAVVAIGEAAPDIEAALGRALPVVAAGSMVDAVHAAAELARPGDVVLLSPACASFDWYDSYSERGDDFARAVLAQAAKT